MTKLTKYMYKYVASYYEHAGFFTRVIWRIRLRLMSDTQVINEYYRITRRAR